MNGSRTITVDLGEGAYDVHVGAMVLDRLADVLADVVPRARRTAVITQAAVGVDVHPGIEHRVVTVPDGEAAKTLEVVGEVCSELARWGLTRQDCVISVGGGVVTDLAGFVAATYHRGVPVIHVSTTLLGQVDAAIGGKTGVNLPEGKNLVGAFWQPAAVLCDTEVLATLPEREWRSGHGEIAKYAFLGAEHDGRRLEDLPLDERIARCVALKADVVADDATEQGRRALLNYGHTLAHALEIAGGFGLRHGEAVAVGLVFAAELARALGRIDDARVRRHRELLAVHGLPQHLPTGVDRNLLVELMARDKKAIDGLTFVLDGPAGPEVITGIGRDALEAAFDAIEPEVSGRDPADGPAPTATGRPGRDGPS